MHVLTCTASHKIRHDKSWTSAAKLCVFGLPPGTSKTTESAFCLLGGKITSPAPGSFLVLIEFDFMQAIHMLGISWPWPKSVALIHGHIPFHSILMPFPLLRLYFSSMSRMSHVIIVIKIGYVFNSYYDMFGVSPSFLAWSLLRAGLSTDSTKSCNLYIYIYVYI